MIVPFVQCVIWLAVVFLATIKHADILAGLAALVYLLAVANFARILEGNR